MKLEKKHWIIIGVVVAIILVWYFFLRKKNGKNIMSKLTGQEPQGRAITHGAPNQEELDRIKAEKTKQKLSGSPVTSTAVQDTAEASFRGGGRGGFHGFGHGHRRGWGWGGNWGYPPYFWYDEPIVIRSTKCPEGWVWMGAVTGCVKPDNFM